MRIRPDGTTIRATDFLGVTGLSAANDLWATVDGGFLLAGDSPESETGVHASVARFGP